MKNHFNHSTNRGRHSAEIILLMSPDHPAYAEIKARIIGLGYCET